MERVAIFGASKEGLNIKRLIEKNVLVIAFVDNNIKKQGEKLDNVSIVSVSDLKEFNVDAVIISVNNVEVIIEQLKENLVQTKIFGIKKYLSNYKNVSELFYEIDIKLPRLNYIEYEVTNHCNLKCRGCSHYSNIGEVGFGDFESFKNDLFRLRKLFWGIRTIRLLGGNYC